MKYHRNKLRGANARQYTARFTDADFAELERLAAERGVSINKLINLAIADFVEGYPDAAESDRVKKGDFSENDTGQSID